MTKQKISNDRKKEDVVEGLREVNPEDFAESKDKEISDQEVADSQPNVKPDLDIDDGGPLSI